ncbi:hypothetical protein KUCAC02_032730, partial [Chaenocephalus aceratus]
TVTRETLPRTHRLREMSGHPSDKIRIATGQIAGVDKDGRALQPHVRIWDSVSLSTLQVIGLGTFERGVGSLAFSKADSGQHLSVVDDCNDHMLTVWEWQKKSRSLRSSEKSTNEVVLEVQFHPHRPPHYRHLREVPHLSSGPGAGPLWPGNRASSGSTRSRTVETSWTGDSGGVLLVWTRSASETPPPSKGLRAFQISRQVKAHEGSVFCVCETRSGSLLTGGGKDRKIILWDQEVPDQYGTIRAVSEGKGDEILVGTSRNFILRGTFNDGFLVEVQGHTDELWGLASHPSRGMFLTCAQDRLVCLWSAEEHRLQWSRSLEEHGHYTTDLVSIHTDGNEQLSVMRFSVDGVLLAVGSHDNLIYLYTVSERGRKYSRYGKCSGHSSYITHLDWSPDNNFIMSNSGDYEILYWDVPNGCKLIRNRSECKDIDWATYTCVLGYHVFGVWPEGSDGTDINALIRSHKRKVIALADDFCKVHLFAYPCSTPRFNGATWSPRGGKTPASCSGAWWKDPPSPSLTDSSLTPPLTSSRPPLSVTTPTQEPISAPTANGTQDPYPDSPPPSALTPPPSALTPPPSDSSVSLKDSLDPSDDTATPSDEGLPPLTS